MQLSKDSFETQVMPSLTMAKQIGNMYCGSLYAGLVSLVSNVPYSQLVGIVCGGMTWPCVDGKENWNVFIWFWFCRVFFLHSGCCIDWGNCWENQSLPAPEIAPFCVANGFWKCLWMSSGGVEREHSWCLLDYESTWRNSQPQKLLPDRRYRAPSSQHFLPRVCGWKIPSILRLCEIHFEPSTTRCLWKSALIRI